MKDLELGFRLDLEQIIWWHPELTGNADSPLHVSTGSAYNHAGRSSGLTSPNGPSQTALVKSALAAAEVASHEVALVSVHGTGTPLGDPIEVGALGQALAAPAAAADTERVILGEAPILSHSLS